MTVAAQGEESEAPEIHAGDGARLAGHDAARLDIFDAATLATPKVSAVSQVPCTPTDDAGGAGQVTNAEFIAAIFPGLPDGASAAICVKSGDPMVDGWWPREASQAGVQCRITTNNYVNSSSFKLGSDRLLRARKDMIAGFHFVVLDDVGTKVPRARLAGVKPSWEIETSPGNSQVGFILKKAMVDAGLVKQLQSAVVGAGLCDPGAVGMARWVRLPQGINGKPKYKSLAGEPFQCRLVQWNPELRYTPEEIMASLQLRVALTEHVVEQVRTTATNLANVAVEPEDDPVKFAKLNKLLDGISPGCGRQDWLKALMAVFHETAGSAAGLELVDRWSCEAANYRGRADVEIAWRSFRRDVANPVTIGTLIQMARAGGVDVNTILRESNDVFPEFDTQVVGGPVIAVVQGQEPRNPLTRFSVRDKLPELEAQMVEQKAILGAIVLLGQATVLYAQANTGKTLIVIWLILDAIRARRIEPAKLFYINMDDNSAGLVDKVRLASEYGFHMLADGHQGFQAKEFRKAMETMIDADDARGVVVVLDTLKKFVNTMDKVQSADFARVVRQFALKGGTVVALAHTNKHPGSDGKPVYSGTTDIVDDFDCAFTLATVAQMADTNQKVVEFRNIKRRGNVALSAAYSYALSRETTYPELVLSVEEIDLDHLGPIKQQAEAQSDAPVVAAVAACIAEGVNTKMLLVDTAAERSGVSKRMVLKVVEKFTGPDPALHRWQYSVGGRGAKTFALLDQAVQPGEVRT